MELIEIHLSEKLKIFSEHSFSFLESTLSFNRFKKKMTSIAYVFAKLWTLKDVVR